MTRRLCVALTLLACLLPGRRVLAARGGPDAGNYTWLDQNEPFVDNQIPTSTGPAVPVAISDETMSAVQTFPGTPAFAFPFYGTSYTQFRISDNGWMTFDTALTNPLPNPSAIPSAATPSLVIAPFWRDLEPAAVPLPLFFEPVAGGVHFRYSANVKSSGEYVQFHWVLYATGVIKFWHQITAVPATVGVGLQKNSTTGLQPIYRGTSTEGFVLADDAVLMFFPPAQVDCTGAQVLACGTPVPGAVTSLAGPNATGYLCSPDTFLAREKVFEFNNPDLGNVHIELSSVTPTSIQLGLFVLAKDACNEFRCIASGTSAVDLDFLPRGKYYVVVDGKTSFDTGTFNITATCSKKGETIACQSPTSPPLSGITGGTSTWEDYFACAGLQTFDGAEYVYELPFTGGNIRAELSNHAGGDLDVLLFPPGDIDPARCAAWADESLVQFDPPNGTWHVLIDGKAGYSGPFDLKITCDIRLDCSSPGTDTACQSVISGSTTGALNKLDDYACSPLVFDGGEAVYRFTQAAAGPVGFRLEGPPDLELLLIQGTCNEAKCLATGDVIVESNLPAGTYYLVVEGVNAASGDFTLTTVCASELDPASLNTVLSPGQCVTENKTAWVSPQIDQLDVLFVQDTTGGQDPFVDTELQSWIDQFLAELDTLTPDVRVGLASFRDYDRTYTICGYTPAYGQAGDYPWRLEQALTTDRNLLRGAVTGLAAAQGGDAPEAYSRAWYETYSDLGIGWRTDARKLVIMIGDDVPHDCNVGQCLSITKASRGQDPGRNGIENDADDRKILDVMDGVRAAGLNPVFIYSPHKPRTPPDDLVPNEVFQLWNCWMTRAGGLAIYATGGLFQPEFPIMVREYVESAARTCRELKLEPSTGYETWMQRPSPASISDFAVPGRASFTFDLCPPISTPSGVYNFTVDLLCEGRKVASQQVTVTTSNCGFNATANVSGRSCAGETRTFDATGSQITSCTGALEYQWRDPNDQVLSAWSTNPVYSTTVSASGTYVLEIRCQNQTECPGSGRKDVPVSVTPAPTANAGNDVSACLNQTVNLGAAPVGGYTYQWSPTLYLNPPAGNTANPTAMPTSATPTAIVYTLTVTDTGGCTAIDTVTLSVVSGAPSGSVGNALRARRAGADVELSWTAGALSPRNYNLHRTDKKAELAFPTPTAPVLSGVGNVETYTDTGAVAAPTSPYLYQVYGRDCSGNSIFQ